jgi:hypothetical protein
LSTPAADPIQFWDWHRVDWNLFDNHTKRLDLDLDNLNASGDVTAMSHAIQDAVEAGVPLRTRWSKPRIPWWHPELDRMRTGVQQAERRVRSTPNPTADMRAWYLSLEKQWPLMLENAREDYHASASLRPTPATYGER